MATINNVTDLIVNKVESQEVFNYMKQNGLVKDDELYIIEGNDAAVLHTPQTLTEEQKAQVRANIGAVASGDLKVATTDTNGLMSSVDKTKLDSIPQEAEPNVQADWYENDETSDAYVHNRTHWVAVERKVWFDNETVTFEEWNGAFVTQIMTEERILIVGQTYNIVIDTESYERVAYEFEGMVCLGNLSIMDSSLTNTNESFFIFSPLPEGASVMIADGNFVTIATSLSGVSHTVTLSADVAVYHKIDENYLPAIIGRPGERVGSEVFNDYVNNFAGGAYAHAEGFSTFASGHASHTEGESTKATFENAHAEGCNTVASGSQSHAEGEGTIADGRNQHVQGKYNIGDSVDKYAHIVGNGTKDSARSNAHTLDWDGAAWFKGSVKVGGTGQDDVEAKTLATTDIATINTNGLMSSEDKTKLDALPSPENIMSTNTILDAIFMRDAANGFTYIVQMMNGNLVSYLKTVSIEITTQPDIMNYLEGTPLDTTGMVISAICEDGSKREITNYTVEGSATVNNPVFIIKYTEGGETHSVELHITVEEFDENILQDFDYVKNNDGTYTLTGWKQTLNGVPSTELVVPDYPNIIV